MQLCPPLGVGLSVSRNRKRKMTRVPRGHRRKGGPTLTRESVLSRQGRRLWAGTFSRTLMFERMTCDGRTACRVAANDHGRAAKTSAGVFLVRTVSAGSSEVKP